ncbi:MAG: hypothetical protein ACKVZJ_02370 [Phycisphaerales bacterium]
MPPEKEMRENGDSDFDRRISIEERAASDADLREPDANGSADIQPVRPDSWLEQAGVLLSCAVLALIGVLAVLVLAFWWGAKPGIDQVPTTRPLSPQEIVQIAGPDVTADELGDMLKREVAIDPAQRIELWTNLTSAHTTTAKDIAQTLLVSLLLPILTLLLGYVFGSKVAKSNAEKKA